MTAVATENVFQTKWGYVATDYATYRKLKRLQYLVLLSLKADAAHWRWARKLPSNRVVRRWVRDAQGRKYGSEIVGPAPEPRDGFSEFRKYHRNAFLTLGEVIVADYRKAKYPRATAAEVGSLTLTQAEIDTYLAGAEAWLASELRSLASEHSSLRNYRTYITGNLLRLSRVGVLVMKFVDGSSEKRRPGRSMSDEQRAKLPFRELIGNISKFVRRDYGGRNPIVAVVDALKKEFGQQSDQSQDVSWEQVAEFIIKREQRVCGGVAERIGPYLRTLLARCEQLGQPKSQT